MSSNIWKVTQDIKAEEYYKCAGMTDDDLKKMKGFSVVAAFSETGRVNALSDACEQMIEAYNEVIDDQNEYIMELDEEFGNLTSLNEELNEKINTLLKEIKELETKEQNGTITDEEREELKNKKEEFGILTQDSKTQLNDKITSVTGKYDDRVSGFRSKEDTAEDYGKLTVEKGTPLANTKVKGGFFRKLFGSTGKGKKAAGERAVKAGNELLEMVDNTRTTDKNIDKSYKRFK